MNDVNEGNDHHHGEYLLMLDLPQKVHGLALAGLKVPPINHEIYARIRERMVSLFTEALKPYPSVQVKLRVIDMQELADSILAKAYNLQREFDEALIVSTCPEIASTSHGMSLEVNRISDISGEIIGIGPRPGHVSLIEQVKGIVACAAGRPIVLVEDGSFTGTTISHVCNMFRRIGSQVDAVVLGFVFPKAMECIGKLLLPPKVYTVQEFENPVDWMPDHDFFPFVPNCGRLIGSKFHGEAYPMYCNYGFPFAVPYLYGYCDMGDWTGLPIDKKQQKELTWYLLDLAISLFQEIEAMNDHVHFGLKGLKCSRPKVALPTKVLDGEGRHPNGKKLDAKQNPLPELGEESVLSQLINIRERL